MARLPKLYPDLWVPRLAYFTSDLLCLGWVALWLYIGTRVYGAVMMLGILVSGVAALGRTVSSAAGELQQHLNNVPFLGASAPPSLASLGAARGTLIGAELRAFEAIHNLALLLSIVVAGLPICVALVRYLAWRNEKTRGMRNLERLLRTPGARAASATLQVLAARALYTLPYEQLLRHTADPIGDWSAGRYTALARATMHREGLDVGRYLRGTDAMHPTPKPRKVGSLWDG